MAKKALEEEDPTLLPVAVRQLEFCPAPTRRHTQFLLSGYLAVKTSGGWTRKWQTRFCVLTPSALYCYKRPPQPTEGTYNYGPEITTEQSKSVVSVNEKLEKEIEQCDVISPQKLQKLLSTADTTDDGGHELFGLVRDVMPIAQSTMIMEVPSLPNTFCLTFPDTPRLLLRAANFEQFKLWQHTIQSAILLQTTPPHMIPQQLARKSPDDNKDMLHLVPHIEELLPVFVDRAAVISQISLHPAMQSLYTDLSLVNKDAANEEKETGAQTEGEKKFNPANIANSVVTNSSIVDKQQVNLNTTASQGHIITNLTPWGQKVNVILNQLPITQFSTPQPVGAQTVEQSVKDNALTLQLADGGYVTIPMEQMYELYKQHMARQAELKQKNSFSSDDVEEKAFSATFADGLFTISNSLYNADIHLGFRFTSMPTTRKENALSKGKKLNPKQLAQIRQQNEQALEKLKNKNTSPTINAPAGLLSLIVSLYLATRLHSTLPQDDHMQVATLWLAYFVLTFFTLKMANITFPFTRRRASLGVDSEAINKMVELSGYQQIQLLENELKQANAAAASTTAASPTSSSSPNVPVLELIPIRLVDRHTITGSVLLGGSKFDHETFPPLPVRTTHTPHLSLLKAIHSNNATSGNKVPGNPFNATFNPLEDDDVDGEGSSSEDGGDDDDDAVYEMNPHLGKVYVEQWGKWSQSDYRTLVLRGPDYLTNKKKPKIPALPQRFNACFTSIVGMPVSQTHAARWQGSYFRKQRQKAIDLGKGDMWKKGTPLKYLVVNMLVPSTPNYNFIMYYRNEHIYPSPYPDHIAQGIKQNYHPSSPDKPCIVYPDQQDGQPDPFAILLNDFITKDDAYRKAHFKYIPNVAEGAWIVKRSVGQTPVIMGNKLNQEYFLDPHGQYVEIDIDVGSSSMAGSILSMVKGYAKTLEIDLSWLMEPHREEELPEKLWAGTRIYNVDLSKVDEIEVVHGPADD